jgi:hypothetical protein
LTIPTTNAGTFDAAVRRRPAGLLVRSGSSVLTACPGSVNRALPSSYRLRFPAARQANHCTPLNGTGGKLQGAAERAETSALQRHDLLLVIVQRRLKSEIGTRPGG